MPNIGVFLVMALIAPGIVITGAAAIASPAFSTYVTNLSPYELIGLIVIVSFAAGHVPFLLERVIFQPVWGVYFPKLRHEKRSPIFAKRLKLLATIESKGRSARIAEQAFAEFIFFFNAGFWLLVIGVANVLLDWSGEYLDYVSGVLGAISLIVLFYTAPIFLSNYIEALEGYSDVYDTSARPERDAARPADAPKGNGGRAQG